MAKALLVNYRWCSGCHSCEVACKVAHGLSAEQYGIKVNEVGPWEVADKKWQLRYFPVLTDQCNLCGERTAAGKLPSCVQHCQSNCLQILDAEKAAEIAAGNKKMLMMTL